MEFTRITYGVGGRRALIALNRPAKRNALDEIMVKELTTALTMAAKDPALKVVTIEGVGPAFCAGADLEYLSRIATFDLEENRADSYRLANLFRLIYELRKPVIALVNGPALAGGCGLASVCDFVIASRENARFGYPEVRIGFIPAVVLLFLVKRIGEGRARELVLRGNSITADEAKQIGLVSMVVPESALQKSAGALIAELLKENSLHAMGLCKEMLSKLQGMNLVDALDYAANMNAAARMSTECRNGIQAFLDKKPIEW